MIVAFFKFVSTRTDNGGKFAFDISAKKCYSGGRKEIDIKLKAFVFLDKLSPFKILNLRKFY